MSLLRRAVRRSPIWVAVHDAADRHAFKVRKAIVTAVQEARDSVDAGELERALMSFNAKMVEAALIRSVAVLNMRLGRVGDILFDTLNAAGSALAGQMRRRGTIRVARTEIEDLDFDLVNPYAAEWARTRAATTVTGISNEVREAIRQIISRSFLEGWPVAQSMRMIRPLIGLLPSHADAVMNLRAEIIANPGKKIWAGNVAIRVPAEGASEEFIARACEAYANRLLSWRAWTIARTETIAAANYGQLELWRQMREKGLLRGDEMKEWITTPDDRLCEFCAALDGETVLIEERFSSGDLMPPAHPNCRCTTGISIRRAPLEPGELPLPPRPVQEAA